jgi:hypothetical protein
MQDFIIAVLRRLRHTMRFLAVTRGNPASACGLSSGARRMKDSLPDTQDRSSMPSSKFRQESRQLFSRSRVHQTLACVVVPVWGARAGFCAPNNTCAPASNASTTGKELSGSDRAVIV